MASKLSPSDRDYAVRTIIGEAGNQDDDGMAAVGHVIMNRTRAGTYGGDTPRAVVLAPSQFEPWQTRAPELMSYAEDSPEYSRAAKIFDEVNDGKRPDLTNGATHFLNEKIVRERRGGTLPKWASGSGQRIGEHTFYGGKPQNSDPADDGIFEEYGRKTPRAVSTAQVDDSVFDDYSRKPVAVTPGGVPVNPKTGRPVINIGPEPADPLGARGFNDRMVSSMPIVGPLLDKAVAATGAVGEPVVNALQGKPTNSTFRERYDANLAAQDERNRLYGEKHPVASVAADVTGGVVGLGPAMGPMSIAAARAPQVMTTAKNVAQRMMGMRGNSLGAKALQGGAGMGAVETGNQLLKGNSPTEQGFLGPVPMAVAGGVLGPAIGEGVGHVANTVIDALPVRSGMLKGANSVTRNRLTGAVDGETPASISESAMAHGRAGMFMDMNQATRDIAGGLADIPGPHKTEIREALRTRAAGQGERLMESLDKNTVKQVNINDLVKTIDDSSKATAGPLYEKFRTAVITPTKEIDALVPRLEKAGAYKLADELAGISGKPIDHAAPTAETWDYVKRGLDRRITTAIDGGDKELYRELVKLKKEMLTEVEKTEGGKVWKQAREAFAEHAEMKHQIEEGQKTFTRATRADDLAEEIRNLSGPERAARVQGARDAVQQIMDNSVRGDTTARNTLLTKAGREKLDILFGKNRASRLINDLEAELKISLNKEEMVGGSPTSGKQARRDALLPARKEPGYLDNLNVTKPATFIPEGMTPSAIMEGAAGARHAAAYKQLSEYLQIPMSDPRFPALVADIMKVGADNAARKGTAGSAATAASTALVTTGGGPRNRLTSPPETERRTGVR